MMYYEGISYLFMNKSVQTHKNGSADGHLNRHLWKEDMAVL